MKDSTKLIILTILIALMSITICIGYTSIRNVSRYEKKIQAQSQLIDTQDEIIKVLEEMIEHQKEVMADLDHIRIIYMFDELAPKCK